MKQLVLLRTDHHDVEGEPDEEWISVQIAGAFLLSQTLLEKNILEDTGRFSAHKHEILKNLLAEFCEAAGFSKWDYRSTWYVKQVLPVGQRPSVMEALR